MIVETGIAAWDCSKTTYIELPHLSLQVKTFEQSGNEEINLQGSS